MTAFVDKMRRRAGRYLGRQPVPIKAPRGVLSLSFDDIPASAWREGGPVLGAHGVKATFYVCGGLAGGTNLDLPQFETEDLQALHADGHEVGCHTFEHVSSLSISPAMLEASWARNAAWVAERLDGAVMDTFAWPFGDCALEAKIGAARRFKLARGVRDGVNAGRADSANLQAIGLESRRIPGYDFDALCAEAAQTNGWLIAYGHDVSDSPTPYGCTQRDVERLILSAKAAGLEILPVSRAFDRVKG